jgi:hypothetical protein
MKQDKVQATWREEIFGGILEQVLIQVRKRLVVFGRIYLGVPVGPD